MTAPHDFGNDPAKIAKYRALWERENHLRPLVGASVKGWFPMQEFSACRRWAGGTHLRPSDIDPHAFIKDQRRILHEGEAVGDDILRGACPFQGVGWLCGMLGLSINVLPDSTVQEHVRMPWDQIAALRLDPEAAWYKKYFEFLDVLVEDSGGDYPVSHGNLSGPTDLFVSFRGGDAALLDLIDEPVAARDAIRHFGDLLAELTRQTWERLPGVHGGCFDAQYQLWSPGPIIRIQEDATSLFSPSLYREAAFSTDQRLASEFAYAFMHLHPAQIFLLDNILEIEGLRCIELNYEPDAGGPDVVSLVPVLRRILEQHVLIFRGEFSMEEIRALRDSLSPEGLYLYCMTRSTDESDALLREFPMTGF